MKMGGIVDDDFDTLVFTFTMQKGVVLKAARAEGDDRVAIAEQNEKTGKFHVMRILSADEWKLCDHNELAYNATQYLHELAYPPEEAEYN